MQQKRGKKREFPNAFALLTLEGWADKNKKIVVVSKDEDWKNFCINSTYLYFVDYLAHALSVFQGDANEVANLFKKAIAKEETHNLDDALLDAMNLQVDKIDINFEVSSNWHYEPELDHITISPAGEPLAQQIKNFEVVEYENNNLVIQTTLTVIATAQFMVSFDQWDSIDRECISIGSTTVTRTEEIDLQLIVTIFFENGRTLLDNIELLSESISMTFNEIEPDWMGSSWDEQDY